MEFKKHTLILTQAIGMSIDSEFRSDGSEMTQFEYDTKLRVLASLIKSQSQEEFEKIIGEHTWVQEIQKGLHSQ